MAQVSVGALACPNQSPGLTFPMWVIAWRWYVKLGGGRYSAGIADPDTKTPRLAGRWLDR